jgi:glycosyltransferase involved in cell wall biosynthesis/Flp pilus assembly protein TadD
MDRTNIRDLKNRDVAIFLQQSEELIQSGKFKEAIELTKSAIKLYPRTSELYLKLGVALERGGDIKEAISVYQQARSIEVRQPFWVYAALCQLLLWQQQITIAVDVGIKGIELYPENAEIYRHLGAALAETGNREQAIAIYQQAIALELQQPPSLYVNLSRLLLDNNQLNEAIAICQQGIELNDGKPDFSLYANLGDALSQQGNIQGAVAAYQQALKIEPEQQSIVSKLSSWEFNVGLFLLSAGSINNAIEHFKVVERVEEWTENFVRWPNLEGQDWPAMPWNLRDSFAALLPDNDQLPKISIVTPSFNQGDYLEETILSVLNQQYPNLEYIIVDGGSSDRTPEILGKYQQQVAQIIVEPDKGQSEAINKGFSYSSGELLMWLNSDDMLFPGALFYLALTYLQTRCDIIAGICVVHRDRKVIALRKPKVRQANFTVAGLADISRLWSTGHFFFQPEVIFTRTAWQQAGGMLDESLNYSMDHDLWLRFAQQQSRLEVINYPVALFRKHSLQKTANNLASVRELLAVTQKYYSPPLNYEHLAKTTDKLAHWLASTNKKMLLVGTLFPESFKEIEQELANNFDSQYKVTICRKLNDIEPKNFEVIIVIVGSPEDRTVVSQIKQSDFTGLLVAWLWEKYTNYATNIQIADSVDICFPQHELSRHLLRTAQSYIASPLARTSLQWTRINALNWFELYGKQVRLEGCCSYLTDETEKKILSLLEKSEVLWLDKSCLNLQLSGEEKFARLANYKVAVCSNIDNEIGSQLFESLIYGQIPIIVGEIEGLDKIIDRQLQSELPIILLDNDSDKKLSLLSDLQESKFKQNLLAVVREAISIFDRQGIAGRIRRNEFVLNNHCLIHRLNEITERFKQLFFEFLNLEQKQAVEGVIDFSIDDIIKRESTMEAELEQSLASYLEKAREAQESGKPERAIVLYREVSQIYPESADIYRLLGMAYEQQGKVAEQIESYLKAIAIEAEQPFWVYSVLIDKLQSVGEVDRAITVGKQGLELYPEEPDLYRHLGVAEYKKGNVLETIANYKQAINLNSAQPFWVYCALVDNLYWQGSLDEAIDIANRGIELYPEQPDLYRHLGLAQQKKGINPGTIKNYRRAIQLQPQQPSWVYTTLGNLLRDRGEIDKAIALYNKAIEHVAESEKSLFLEQLREATIAKASVKKEPNAPAPLPSSPSAAANTPQIFAQMNDKEFTQYIYLTFLKRKADPKGLEGNLKALKNNVPRTVILENILTSQEFSIVNNQTVLPELSNYEFLHAFWEFLLGRSCDWDAEQVYLGHLERGLSRVQFILEIAKTEEFKERIKSLDLASENRTKKKKNNAWIMGTENFVNQDQWDKVLFEVLCQEIGKAENSVLQQARSTYQPSPLVTEYLANNNTPLVSVITSLYKGRDYIEAFMKNITTQTIFERTELIIIDANSPENESEIIEPYLAKFPNIKYIRTETTIGIYEAWNLGAIKANGQFLTNANADDCRRFDCLEKQAEALLQNEEVDLVYQDLFYSLTPNLPFEIIAKCNFKTELPQQADRENMLKFNSPHNAPMWRKKLHEKVGLFNSIYRSAGDYELWLRALLKDAQFRKIEEPVVAYYNNPSGISTRNESAGGSEAQEIQVIYNNLFGGSLLSMSESDFVDFCQTKFNLNVGFTPSRSGSSWRDKISFFDRFFEEKTKQLAQEKFYVSLL